MKNLNLYTLMKYTRKNSILKSVVITNKHIQNGRFRVVEVEPYDTTGTNCLDSTPLKYDKALNTIENALHRLEKRISKNPNHIKNIYYIKVFSNRYEPFEYIFDPISKKTW